MQSNSRASLMHGLFFENSNLLVVLFGYVDLDSEVL